MYMCVYQFPPQLMWLWVVLRLVHRIKFLVPDNLFVARWTNIVRDSWVAGLLIRQYFIAHSNIFD